MLEFLFNILFSPILRFPPVYSILIISTIVTAAITLVNKKMMDSKKVKEVREKMEKAKKELLEGQKEGKKDSNKQMEKMVQMNTEYLQALTKPLSVSLIISMLLIILFYPWMRTVYGNKVIVIIPKIVPIIGGKSFTWLLWYVISSIFATILLKIVGL